MNIFYLHHNPKQCAEQHVDKHCVKMILEYAQLLSTAHRVLDGHQSTGLSKTGRKQTRYVLSGDREHTLYTATHINHPSAVWVRQSKANYIWLWTLLSELCKEYTYRYGRTHKCESSGLVKALCQFPDNLKADGYTEPTPAMPDEFKVADSSIKSYHNYYNGPKAHFAKWTGRPTPSWFNG